MPTPTPLPDMFTEFQFHLPSIFDVARQFFNQFGWPILLLIGGLTLFAAIILILGAGLKSMVK